MATLAADRFGTKKAAPAAAPISAHPAFPAIVALWFAALLGLGSLVLPLVLLERLTTVSGLASLVPSAAPPLGFTARATIALAAALSGAVLGLLLARQVAKGQAPTPRQRFAAETRRPISAHEELGEEGLGSAAPKSAGQKRRALAISEDNRRSEYLPAAPLPGQAYEPPAEVVFHEEETLELGEYAEPEAEVAAHDDQDFSMTKAPDGNPPRAERDRAEEGQEFTMPSGDAPRMPQAFDPMADGEDEDFEDASEQTVDALPFAAPSLRRSPPPAKAPVDLGHEPGDETEDRPQRSFAAPMPQAYEPESLSPKLAVVESDDHDMEEFAGEDRPLEDLGLVQLATRLGAAIERRRALRASGATATERKPVFSGASEDFDAAAADEAAAARANFFGRTNEIETGDGYGAPPPAARVPQPPAPASAPAASFDDLDLEEDDEYEADELTASFSLPLRKRSDEDVHAPRMSDFEDEEPDEDLVEEEEYSSLLAMKNPFAKKAEFVRVEEPEPQGDEIESTVTFPPRKGDDAAPEPRPFDPPSGPARKENASAQRDHGDAERELRAALETLQRMSGAA